eukprot:910618_1
MALFFKQNEKRDDQPPTRVMTIDHLVYLFRHLTEIKFNNLKLKEMRQYGESFVSAVYDYLKHNLIRNKDVLLMGVAFESESQQIGKDDTTLHKLMNSNKNKKKFKKIAWSAQYNFDFNTLKHSLTFVNNNKAIQDKIQGNKAIQDRLKQQMQEKQQIFKTMMKGKKKITKIEEHTEDQRRKINALESQLADSKRTTHTQRRMMQQYMDKIDDLERQLSLIQFTVCLWMENVSYFMQVTSIKMDRICIRIASNTMDRRMDHRLRLKQVEVDSNNETESIPVDTAITIRKNATIASTEVELDRVPPKACHWHYLILRIQMIQFRIVINSDLKF